MRHSKKITPISKEERVYFDGFLLEYEKLILHIAKKYQSPGIQTDDIRQEAIIRLMFQVPKLQTLDHNETCAYISRTVKNTFLDLWKKENRHSHVSMDSVLEEMLGTERDLVPELFMRQELRRLRENLPAKEWEALKSKYAFGCSQEEVGQQLGIAPDSVRMFLHRVKKRALGILAPEKVTGGDGDD